MKISTINSIEISSLCNLKCQYCPASAQKEYRDVGLMDMETFKRAIIWVQYFADRGTQLELNLFGVGEPLLNPQIAEFVRIARVHVPMSREVHLNTNGIFMTREMGLKLKDAGISSIDITGHDPYHSAKTIRILRDLGIPGQLSIDPIVRPNDWAGQVDWFESEFRYDCPWIYRGQVMVMSDGSVTVCCIDAFAKGVLGSVKDDLAELEVEAFELCKSCHHDVPERIVNEESQIIRLGSG